jgi:hypothetical protein
MEMPCRECKTLPLRYSAKISQVTQFHKEKLSLFLITESKTNVATSYSIRNPIGCEGKGQAAFLHRIHSKTL